MLFERNDENLKFLKLWFVDSLPRAHEIKQNKGKLFPENFAYLLAFWKNFNIWISNDQEPVLDAPWSFKKYNWYFDKRDTQIE